MTEQEEKRLEALLEMFNSKGWKEFQLEVAENLKISVESAPDTCIDGDQWQFRRGEILKLKQFAGYEDFIRASLEVMENEDAQLQL